MEDKKNRLLLQWALVGGALVVAILVLGTLWVGASARDNTEDAVRSVSLLYLDELAGRREQVVSANLQTSIRNLNVSVDLMTPEDLSDAEHLQAYQARMKQLYDIEKFAFVDTTGLIYTSQGIQTNIDDYDFDYANLTEPDISVLNLNSEDKKVIIAVPVDNIPFEDQTFEACFMEIDMDRLLEGVSVQSSNTDTTFCNLYTSDGIALTSVVLGGLASEDNLLDALSHAVFEGDGSASKVRQDFAEGRKGIVSFTYDGIKETLAYAPVEGTNWLLTYLIRESVISDQIGSVSEGIIARSLLLSAITAAVLIAMFVAIVVQSRRSMRLTLESEKSAAEARIKREELEERLELQQELLEQEQQRAEQDKMITALASDYRSVYYVDLDKNEGICYQGDHHLDESLAEGSHFDFHQTFLDYANKYVAEQYREGFLRFIEPDTIREQLQEASVVAYRYLVVREDKESYEMLRMAGVRHIEDREDGIVHAVGVGFTNIDAEMRESMAKNQALSDALAAAEDASKAKTTFLSNMSHEIRTPMNTIIGLDNIALADETISDSTRDYLQKIGRSADHLLSLINDILDMSRIESGRMTLKNEEFSFPVLMEQINTVFSAQCEEKNLTYKCQVDTNIRDYYIGDSIKLRQVLINILSNAVKFTPKGGTVSIDASCIAHFEDKSTLQFVIADTGIGMSEEFLPHIFDTFSQEDASSTNKYGSSGLGMAICKSIVEMMNGKIDVVSAKGEGTTFTVAVTLRDAGHDVVASVESANEIAPHEMRVLVVDDDPIACEHARLVFEKAGIACDVAQSGHEAIDKVKVQNARRSAYHLILVDWKMPEMDGVETTRRIREIAGDKSAIIILTAYRWDDVLEEALEAGVDSFVSKPLFANTVLEEYSSVRRRRGTTQVQKTTLEGSHVLIAEDVDINAEILEMLLDMREVTHERASNGREAVDMFAASDAGLYDAILMDIRMPEMDGIEATTTIRAMDRKDAGTIPIIALTANAFDEDVQRSLQAGLNAHLTKPVDPDALFDTLESLL